jgi:hypothetical protein
MVGADSNVLRDDKGERAHPSTFDIAEDEQQVPSTPLST